MPKLPSIGLILVPQPPISMARVSVTNTSVGARHCPLVCCDVKVNAVRSELAGVFGRRDVTVGATSRRNVQTGAQCRFQKTYTWGSRVTSHSDHEHDYRIRFSHK